MEYIFLSTLSLRRATYSSPASFTPPLFLSTLSLRRATALRPCKYTGYFRYFYPRSPCGERQQYSRCRTRRTKFLSTLSLRRATGERYHLYCGADISIHALLAESDQLNAHTLSGHSHFYPRSPCGERHPGLRAAHSATRISIHALLAESDICNVPQQPCVVISIHALLAESDCKTCVASDSLGLFLSTLSLRRATLAAIYAGYTTLYFYPRSPCGERRLPPYTQVIQPYISIHALLAESDARCRSRALPGR